MAKRHAEVTRRQSRSVDQYEAQIKTTNSVAAILLNDNEDILLQLRDDRPDVVYPNHWGPIGGHIENGETAREAMIREIQEEINIRIDDVQEVVCVHVDNEEMCSYVTFFKGYVNRPVEQMVLNEGQKIDFFAIDELDRIKVADIVRDVILRNKRKIFSRVSVRAPLNCSGDM